MKADVVVIGGGAAGIAAAASAKRSGAHRVLLLDRGNEPGGILTQCIHTGFGLHRRGSELTGPEYAALEYAELEALGVEVLWNTTALSINKSRAVTILSQQGYQTIYAGAIVLATGSRERTRGAIMTPGTRPAGVYTAGTAQQFLNLHGLLVGKEIVILGSGDIGLIMARRLTLEGAHVVCVLEMMDEPGGLRRNVVQCLEDFDIPLHLSTTVTEIRGRSRVSEVVVSQVDPRTKQVVSGTERVIPCDTLLLSVGLIPERELAVDARIVIDEKTGGPQVNERLETSVKGIFSCGNVLHIHDLVDFASQEGERAGAYAAKFAHSSKEGSISHAAASYVRIVAGENIGSVTPQKLTTQSPESVSVSARVTHRIEGARLVVRSGEDVLARKRFRILIPSEMVSVDVGVSPEFLAKIKRGIAKDIVVSVEATS